MTPSSKSVPRPPRALVATNHLYLLLVTALATTLMLQTMRVFTSYMIFIIDQSQRAELALTVSGTFLTVALGGVLLRWVGFRRTLLIGAFIFGFARLALQFWELPVGRLVLGAVALASWGWLMIAVFRHWRESAAIGIGFGIALDMIIRIAFASRDLPLMPGPAEHLLSVILVVGMAVGVAGIRTLHIQELPEISTRAVWSLAAFGPGIALYHILTGNLGLAQIAAGVTFPEGAVLLALGTALGLRFALMAGQLLPAPEGARINTAPLLVGILLAIGIFLISQEGVIAIPGLILAPAAGMVLIVLAVAGKESSEEVQPSIRALTATFTVGLLLEVGLLFLYFINSGQPVFLGLIAGVFVLLALHSSVPDISHPIYQPRLVLIGAGAIAALLAAVSGWHLLTWTPAEEGAPGGEEITVMTYNIQNGFDRENRWDLEATAQTIEDEDPDVVAIQEIGRGWLATTSIDHVTWLSQRLDMPYYFAPNSDDGLWGNAVFTRLPVNESDTTQYSAGSNLKRGAIEVSVETESGPVWIYGTHLDNPLDGNGVRFTQGEALLEFWDGKRPALVLGDFNSEPDTPLMQELTQRGLRDLGAELPAQAITSETERRIDYILATENLELVDIHITEIWTSDHLPVTATVRIPD